VLDAVFWALQLGSPTSVDANISTYWHEFWQRTEPKNETYPRSTIVRYKFPARGTLPPVALTWWDGGLMPPRPKTSELVCKHNFEGLFTVRLNGCCR
jgi:hypothetical protein